MAQSKIQNSFYLFNLHFAFTCSQVSLQAKRVLISNCRICAVNKIAGFSPIKSDVSGLMLLFSTNESSSEIAEIIEIDVFGFGGFCPAIKEGI
jgi:hypothetical protein